MMDSKQLALVYLMEESNRMASVCTKNVHALHAKTTLKEVENQMGVLFAAMREVAEELKCDEEKVQIAAEKEFEKRSKER